MATYDLFSKRQKKLRGEFPDVYQYENLPNEFRVQVVHIIQDTVGKSRHGSGWPEMFYESIHKVLCKEYGIISLCESDSDEDDVAILNFFLRTKNHEECLDIIEIFFKIIEGEITKNYNAYQDEARSTQDPNDAISELNQRFKEWGIGYEFQNGELIRIDSQFIHSETVKPVLVLLANDQYYEGANQEFLKAHEHYRHKRYKECLVDCGNAFESLMKAICKKRNWAYTPKDNASKLIDICHNNNLIPSYIRSFLESGVPTIRNKKAAHGQGAEISEVPEHLASYCLHLTASNLLFLANCEKQLP